MLLYRIRAGAWVRWDRVPVSFAQMWGHRKINLRVYIDFSCCPTHAFPSRLNISPFSRTILMTCDFI